MCHDHLCIVNEGIRECLVLVTAVHIADQRTILNAAEVGAVKL